MYPWRAELVTSILRIALGVTAILEVSREYLVPSVAVSVHDKRFSVTFARQEFGATDTKPIPAITRDILEALAQQTGGTVSFSDSTRKIILFTVPLNMIPPAGSTGSSERD